MFVLNILKIRNGLIRNHVLLFHRNENIYKQYTTSSTAIFTCYKWVVALIASPAARSRPTGPTITTLLTDLTYTSKVHRF